MADEKTQTRKPRQSRKSKTATAKTDPITQVASTASQSSNEQSQVTGHYQAVLPPTSDPITIDVPNEPRAMDVMLSFAASKTSEGSQTPFLIQVKSKDTQRGFWRCGLFFSPDGCTLTVETDDGEKLSSDDGAIVSSVTMEQYQRLVNEPRLIVKEL